MSISFFIPDSPKRLVSAYEKYPSLIREDFEGDPEIKWINDEPFLLEREYPELNVTIYSYHHFLKKAIANSVSDLSSLEEGWGSWHTREELEKAKIGLLTYLSTGVLNDVQTETVEGNHVFCEYSIERIENIVHQLISVIDTAIEHKSMICWG
jgi:hypothetical protein